MSVELSACQKRTADRVVLQGADAIWPDKFRASASWLQAEGVGQLAGIDARAAAAGLPLGAAHVAIEAIGAACTELSNSVA